MDKKDYLQTLKTIDMRPAKVKIKESRPSILMEQGDNGMADLHNEIIKWFMSNPSPADSDVHEFADKLGVPHDKFEGHIYMILGSLLTEGRSKEFRGPYDPQQLSMGIEVEKEHTSNLLIAEKIAKDHLAEVPDYYTRLKKMEAEAGIKEQKNINEIFIQSSEIENMPSGTERDIQILRLSIIAELDASNLYEKLSQLTSDERVTDVLLDVSKEEKVHVGEFQTLLNEIDVEHEPAVEEGEDEVEELI